MANKAVSNTGPIIHLSEINFLHILKIFQIISIPEEVESEIRNKRVSLPKKIKVLRITSNSKDIVAILTNQYCLDMGESEAIALALQEKADFFLTDDLDARMVANAFNLNVHGTVGIIMRAFRNKIINKETAILKIKDLKITSSLFVTQYLIQEAIDSINEYKDR